MAKVKASEYLTINPDQFEEDKIIMDDGRDSIKKAFAELNLVSTDREVPVVVGEATYVCGILESSTSYVPRFVFHCHCPIGCPGFTVNVSGAGALTLRAIMYDDTGTASDIDVQSLAAGSPVTTITATLSTAGMVFADADRIVKFEMYFKTSLGNTGYHYACQVVEALADVISNPMSDGYSAMDDAAMDSKAPLDNFLMKRLATNIREARRRRSSRSGKIMLENNQFVDGVYTNLRMTQIMSSIEPQADGPYMIQAAPWEDRVDVVLTYSIVDDVEGAHGSNSGDWGTISLSAFSEHETMDEVVSSGRGVLRPLGSTDTNRFVVFHDIKVQPGALNGIYILFQMTAEVENADAELWSWVQSFDDGRIDGFTVASRMCPVELLSIVDAYGAVKWVDGQGESTKGDSFFGSFDIAMHRNASQGYNYYLYPSVSNAASPNASIDGQVWSKPYRKPMIRIEGVSLRATQDAIDLYYTPEGHASASDIRGLISAVNDLTVFSAPHIACRDPGGFWNNRPAPVRFVLATSPGRHYFGPWNRIQPYCGASAESGENYITRGEIAFFVAEDPRILPASPMAKNIHAIEVQFAYQIYRMDTESGENPLVRFEAYLVATKDPTDLSLATYSSGPVVTITTEEGGGIIKGWEKGYFSENGSVPSATRYSQGRLAYSRVLYLNNMQNVDWCMNEWGMQSNAFEDVARPDTELPWRLSPVLTIGLQDIEDDLGDCEDIFIIVRFEEPTSVYSATFNTGMDQHVLVSGASARFSYRAI